MCNTIFITLILIKILFNKCYIMKYIIKFESLDITAYHISSPDIKDLSVGTDKVLQTLFVCVYAMTIN